MFSHLKVDKDQLTSYLVEDRRGSISRWGLGNSKLGQHVFTYSRLPGREGGTCPGSSLTCERMCYAKKVAVTNRPVWGLWEKNTWLNVPLPKLPKEAKLVRIHVSGDFDSQEYIEAWTAFVSEHPDVTFWTYTRSWRIPTLCWYLEKLRALPNIQVFASTDEETERPPEDWRVAWMASDKRASGLPCPENTGERPNCEDCKYCFVGRQGDVVFQEH